MKPDWQFRELIRALGGPVALREKLLDQGFTPPASTAIWGWYRRDSIPGAWAMAVLMLAQRENFLPDLSRLLRR